MSLSRDNNAVWNSCSKISGDDGFSLVVASLVTSLGGEQHLHAFKKYKIGQRDLSKLTNEDLIILGVDDLDLREAMLKTFKNKADANFQSCLKFGAADQIKIYQESTKLIELMKLSLYNTKMNVVHAKHREDVLVKSNTYATDVMLETIEEIERKMRAISYIAEQNVKNKSKKSTIARNIVFFGGAITLALCAYYLKTKIK